VAESGSPAGDGTRRPDDGTIGALRRRKGENGYDGRTMAGIGLKRSVGHGDSHPGLLGWR
jgi:hypothetical protein